jgi:hypothetical protein
VTVRQSAFREALQVSPERIAALDEVDLNVLLGDLLRAHAYRCGAKVSEVNVNTEGKAKDDGCDGWSPAPPVVDEWFGPAVTCWQFKARGNGTPANLRGEVRKRIPRETLKAGGRFVVIASGSKSGPRGERDRLATLLAEAKSSKIPRKHIVVLGSERLTTWCNQHPAVAARFAGYRDGVWLLDDWANSEPHRVTWQSTPTLDQELDRLRQGLDFAGGALVHVHIQGHPGVGKTRFVLELCQRAPWKSTVVYVRNASDLRLSELIDGATSDAGVRVLVVADEVQSAQLPTLRDSLDRGGGRVRLITIGHCKTPDPTRIPAVSLAPLDMQAMARVITGWHQALPREHVEFVARFADGYVRLAKLASDAVAQNHSLDVRGLLSLDHIRMFLDRMLDGGDRRALHVVAVLSNVGWEDERAIEGQAIAQHFGLDWNDVRVKVEKFQDQHGIAPRGGRCRYISPTPLGIRLAVEAWTAHSDLLRTLPAALPTEAAKAAYYERLEEIASNPYARKFAQEELAFFFSVMNFVEPFEARRWSALSAADPALAARNILQALSAATVDERLTIQERARREVVHALVRLAWNRASFRAATMSLALLGEAENETWANNASKEFVNRFELALSGTSVPYTERLGVVDDLVTLKRPALDRLVVRALARVGNRHHVRMSSGPPSDAAPEPEWHATTAAEVIACVEQALARLTAMAKVASPEILGELVTAAQELSMLLRESAVRGVVVGFLEALRDAHPSTREPLRRVIADILFRERKYWNDLSPEELAAIEAVHARFEDASRSGRLRQQVGPGMWEKEETPDTLVELAAEFVDDPDALAHEWPWLTSGEASDAWKFGECLAAADRDGAFDDVLPGLPGRGPDLRVVCGYVATRRQQRGDAWFDAWMTRHLAARPDDFALLFEVSWRGGVTAATAHLLATTLSSREVPPQFTHQLENGAWPHVLPLDALTEILSALTARKHRAVAIAVLDHRLRHHPEDLEPLRTLARDLVTSGDVIRRGTTMTDYYWKEVAVRLLPQAASAIAAAIFREQADRSDRTWFAEYSTATEVIARVVQADPAGVWRALAPHLRSVGEGLHFSIGFPLGVLDQMPGDDVGRWVEEQPEERAAVIARLVSKNVSSDDTLMARVLGQFGDNKRIASSFFSAYVSGSWMGPSSEHWARLAEGLELVVKTTKLPKLRIWAEEAARGLREMSQRDGQREEEEALRGR